MLIIGAKFLTHFSPNQINFKL